MVFWKSCGGAQCDHHFRCFWLRGARENTVRAVAKGRGDFCYNDTVDGSEILRSPVEVASLSQYLRRFLHPRWCRISEPSTVYYCKVISQWYLPEQEIRAKKAARGTLCGSQSLIKHHLAGVSAIYKSTAPLSSLHEQWKMLSSTIMLMRMWLS